MFFPVFFALVYPLIPFREFFSPGLDPVMADVLLVLPRLWRLFFFFLFFFLVLFSVGFLGKRLHGTSVLGSCFSGVSPTSFSDCDFLMSSLKPDLCSSAGSFMTRASLWWRLVVSTVVCCRGRSLVNVSVYTRR